MDKEQQANDLKGALMMCEKAVDIVETTPITLRENRDLILCFNWLCTVRDNIKKEIEVLCPEKKEPEAAPAQ